MPSDEFPIGSQYESSSTPEQEEFRLRTPDASSEVSPPIILDEAHTLLPASEETRRKMWREIALGTRKHSRPVRSAEDASGEPSMFEQPGAVELEPETMESLENSISDEFTRPGEPGSDWQSPGGVIAINVVNNKVGPPKNFLLDLDPVKLHAYKLAQIQQRILAQTTPLKFTGDVELFLDRDVWNVSLTGGGLSRTVRFQPGKDSTNAKTLATFARGAITDAALDAMGTLDSESFFVTTTRTNETILVRLHLTQDEKMAYNLFFDVRDGELIVSSGGARLLKEFEATQRREILDLAHRVVEHLQANVAHLAGLPVSFADYLQAKTRKAITLRQVTATGFGQVLLPQDCDLAQVILTEVSGTEVRLSRAVLVVHPKESMLVVLDGSDIGIQLSEIITSTLAERGVNTAFSSVYVDDEFALDADDFKAQVFFDPQEDTCRGYIECIASDAGGQDKKSVAVFVVKNRKPYLVVNAADKQGQKALIQAWKQLAQREGWRAAKTPAIVSGQDLPPLFV